MREKYYDLAVEKVAKLINNLDTLDDEFKNNLVEHIKSGKFDDGENKKPKKSKVKVKDAITMIINKEIENTLDNDAIGMEAIKRVEENGIIFIDEILK